MTEAQTKAVAFLLGRAAHCRDLAEVDFNGDGTGQEKAKWLANAATLEAAAACVRALAELTPKAEAMAYAMYPADDDGNRDAVTTRRLDEALQPVRNARAALAKIEEIR